MGLIALTIFTGSGLYLLMRPKPASAAWYDDSWAYRTEYTVNNSGAADSNKKVKFDIDTATLISAGKMQSDCGDSRFTDGSGNLLRYFIDTAGGDCNTNSTDYYVLIPTINAGATRIFHYYGNPSAQNGTESAQFSEATFTPSSTSSASEEKAPSPAAYWSFDDGTGTNAQDSTSNNNDGTLDGATWQTEDLCVSGKCLYFDGTNDVVTVSNTVSNIQSVSFWIRPTTTSEQFIDLNGSAYIQSSSGTISATGFTSPTVYVNGKVSSTITANQWQYITVTTGSALSGSAIKIGQISTNYGQGFIDEVKVYNYARSAAQILTDYNGRSSLIGVSAQIGSSDQWKSLSQGLVGYWKMDEASWSGTSADILDSSGNGNEGTANCSGASCTKPTGGAAGKFGNGGSFDGSQDYVSFSGGYPLSVPQQLTVSFWMNPNAVNEGYIINLGWFTFRFNTSASLITLNGISTSNTYPQTGNTWTTSSWQHVIVRWDGSKVYLYKNGVQIYSTNASGTLTAGTSCGQRFGQTDSCGGGGFYNGNLDEVRVYNRALSPNEVPQLYNFAPGPRVELKMEEGSGTSANDTSGNGRTGTLNGNPVWSTGKYGKGVKMDGTGDNISVSDF